VNFAAVTPSFASQRVLCLLYSICDYLVVAWKELYISIKLLQVKKR